MSQPNFVPKTAYVTYIASTPEKVWAALTEPEFTRQYFFGRSVELEQRVGGSFILRMPDGRVDVQGRVVECVTWRVEWIEDMRKLPECLVTYEIEALDGAVRLTLTEAHQWDVPDAILAGGRLGWPAILSSSRACWKLASPLW
jgi:uncharacterized protein YndB with AHSA1/START domain